jgi:hypothetical protein
MSKNIVFVLALLVFANVSYAAVSPVDVAVANNPGEPHKGHLELQSGQCSLTVRLSYGFDTFAEETNPKIPADGYVSALLPGWTWTNDSTLVFQDENETLTFMLDSKSLKILSFFTTVGTEISPICILE